MNKYAVHSALIVAGLFYLFAYSAVAQDSPTFDERVATRWALTALGVKHSKVASQGELTSLLKSTTTKAFRPPNGPSAAEIGSAFDAIQPCRVTHSQNDLSIAAAEHYLYMRFRSADTGDKRYHELPAMYLQKKKEKISDGTVKDLQTTSQPVSPPSEDVRRWGEIGADDGAIDYKRLTGNDATNGASAYIEGALFVLFARYRVPEGRPCTLKLD